MNFEWDENKAAENLTKHAVSFEEASTAVLDPLAVSRPDDVYADRDVVIGMSSKSRVLYVVVTEFDEEVEGESGETKRDTTVRIISARRATNHERKEYEEKG